MLLMAGFVISATAIVAIGTYTALQSGTTQVAERTNRPLVELFLNTRERAVEFFDLVTEDDTTESVERNLHAYLASQRDNARSMSIELNASLAGGDEISPKAECPRFVDAAGASDCSTSDAYVAPLDAKLWDQDGGECFSGLPYDDDNDGLVTASDGTILGAIFWLKVEGVDTTLEEYVLIDVPGTSPSEACKTSWTDVATNASGNLHALADTASGLFAVGDGGDVLERGTSEWFLVDQNGPDGTDPVLLGADATDDGERLWIAGDNGAVGEYDPAADAMNDHTGLDNSYTGKLNDVAATGDADAANVYAVDANGHVQYSFDDGQTWQESSQLDSGNSLVAVDFHAPEAGHLVNANHKVYETTDGESWTEIGISTTVGLNGIDSDGPDDVWVAGDSGEVFHYDGSAWSSTTVGSADLHDVEVEDGDGYAVAGNGDIYHYDGSGWSNPATASNGLNAVDLGFPRAAVGASDTVLER